MKKIIASRVLRAPITLWVLTLDTSHLLTAEDSLWANEERKK